MKLIMENWRKFLAEEKVCVDGYPPSNAKGREGLICRDGTAPIEQSSIERPEPVDYPDKISLKNPYPQVDTPMAVPPTIINAIVAYATENEHLNQDVFLKYFDKAERYLVKDKQRELQRRSKMSPTRRAREDERARIGSPLDLIPKDDLKNLQLTIVAAGLMAKDIGDKAVDQAEDISKEFKYAKQVATKKANDFVTNHLDGENATHRQIYRQLKKDLRSLNPFN